MADKSARRGRGNMGRKRVDVVVGIWLGKADSMVARAARLPSVDDPSCNHQSHFFSAANSTSIPALPVGCPQHRLHLLSKPATRFPGPYVAGRRLGSPDQLAPVPAGPSNRSSNSP